MSALATMKQLIAIGLPAKWLVPVMEAFENPEATATVKKRRKRRKRRTKEEMARDAAKAVGTKKKRKKKAKATPDA